MNDAPIPPKRPSGAGEGTPLQKALEKFQALPTAGKLAVVGGGLLLSVLAFGGRGGNNQATGSPTLAAPDAGQPLSGEVSPSSAFTGLQTDRQQVMQSVFEQNRREMTDLRQKMEGDFATRDAALNQALQQSAELQRQMQQMMADFTAEIKNMQAESSRDRERLGQVADQQKQMELNAPVGSAGAPSPVVNQQSNMKQSNLYLGPPPGGVNNGGLSGAVNQVEGRLRGIGSGDLPPSEAANEPDELPFVPPLGFVKATLLNGVDALVGGQGIPALARIKGNYTTAMSSQVQLDGCMVMIEFNGDASTERAVGKPARMTCVYPDRGAATYELSGYVVDANDGIIGVPGVYYEGDPTRITASILADFAAGIGQIAAQNQRTTTTNADGVQTSSVTGSDVKAEIAGGADKMLSSLSDYLKQKVDKVQPFVRLDATREVHLVLLNGTELRSEGSPWTLLFDASGADRKSAPQGRRPSQAPGNPGQGG
jgi:hypothetical protein